MAQHSSASVIDNHIDPRLRARVPMDEIKSTLWGGLNSTFLGGGRLLCATHETHPEIMQAFAIMSERAGVDTPKLAILESDIPNAMAVAKDRVVITTGMLQKLTYDETVSVLGHELGHVQNFTRHSITRRYVPVGMFAGLETLAGVQVNKWMPDSPRSIKGAIVLGAGIVGQKLGTNIVVRPTEYEADLVGANVSKDPGALASALDKIDPNRDGYFRTTALSWISGYPRTQDRINKLHTIEKCPDIPAAQVADRAHEGRAVEMAAMQR